MDPIRLLPQKTADLDLQCFQEKRINPVSAVQGVKILIDQIKINTSNPSAPIMTVSYDKFWDIFRGFWYK